MRILIFGAGAIGSVLGGFLANANHDVTLLGRSWHLDAVRQHGLRVSGLWGEHRITHAATVTSLDAVAEPGALDWVLVCVKAHQTAEASRALSAFLGPPTFVCAFQNGLGNYEALIQHLAPSRVALGRVIFGAELEPSHVRVTVCADEVLIGAPDPAFPREQASRLASALQESGIPTRTTTTIVADLWAKVLYNCALNGLSTLLEVPYGKLLEHETTKRLMRAVIEEAYRVAEIQRVTLSPSSASAYIQLLFTRLIPDTAAHRSSMLQDIRRGRLTEIDALNGAIARLARDAGVAAPMNALVAELVHEKERFLSI